MQSLGKLKELRAQAEAALTEDRDAVAAELFAAYLKQRPEDGFAWFRYGDALRRIGLRDEAERALLRAQELEPDRWMIPAYMGQLYLEGGDHDNAERCFARALRDPDAATRTWVWIMRGAALA